MDNFPLMFLGLLVAFGLGYELGQTAMLRRIRAVLDHMAEEFKKATKAIETHKEKEA